jgi:single-stranded DNA-binding protein
MNVVGRVSAESTREWIGRFVVSMNTVTLVGTITKDPRIFVTPTDKMTLFTVATKKRSGASEFISVSSASQTLAGHVEQKRFQKGYERWWC